MNSTTARDIAEQAGVTPRTVMRVLREQGNYVPSASTPLPVHTATGIRRVLAAGSNAYLLPRLSGAESRRAAAMLERLPLKLPELLRGIGARVGEGGVASIVRNVLSDPQPFLVWGGDRMPNDAPIASPKELELFELPSSRGAVAFRSARASGLAEVHFLFWRRDVDSLSLATFEAFRDEERTGGTSHMVVHRGRLLEVFEGDAWIRVDGDPILAKFADLWQQAASPRLPNGAFAEASDARAAPSSAAEMDSIALVPLISKRHDTAVDGHAWQRRAVNRWVIRGHWRNQWYPSQSRHHPVWIDEHSAGAVTDVALPAQRVYTLP